MSFQKAKQKAKDSLLGRPGISGVSEIDGRIRIYVEDYNPVAIPRTIGGHEVENFRAGHIRALDTLMLWTEPEALEGTPWFIPQKALDPLRTTRHRPIPGGVSIGHPSITAGTHGGSLRFLGYDLGMSNNHVLAAASSIQNIRAAIGDPIIQPGTYDGGTLADAVGRLYNYIPFDEAGMNFLDVALWKPTNPADLDDFILEIGEPKGITTFKVGDTIQKSGRTTGLTIGVVQDIDAAVSVDYGAFVINFDHQIVTDNMADGGDSGSWGMDMTPNLGGLLFAGSDYVTIYNPIAPILSWLGGVRPNGKTGGLRQALLPLIVGLLIL